MGQIATPGLVIITIKTSTASLSGDNYFTSINICQMKETRVGEQELGFKFLEENFTYIYILKLD